MNSETFRKQPLDPMEASKTTPEQEVNSLPTRGVDIRLNVRADEYP